MKEKKLFLGFIVIVFILVLLLFPFHEVESSEVVWRTDESIRLRYLESTDISINLEGGSNLTFIPSGEPMQDTVSIAIYNSSGASLENFAQIGNYRVANWVVPYDDVYTIVFQNPVRWDKNVSIKIVEKTDEKVSTLELLFS